MSTSSQHAQKNLGIYIVIGAVLLGLILVAGGGAFISYTEAKKDNDAYEVASAGGSKPHFEAYLARFPGGKHVQSAQKALDDLDWQTAPRTIAGYSGYLKAHPNGSHAPEAREKVDAMAWESLGARGDILGMRRYLDQFPEGRHAKTARAKIDEQLSCNRAYAQRELAQVANLSGLVEASSEGASNLISRKQGTAYSTTQFSGNTATTYHHDGSYNSQDGVEVRYRITNDSKFLVFSRVEGTVSFRTKAGVFWRGLVGGWLGAAVGAARDPNNGMNEGAVAGAKKGYEMAKHSEAVVVAQALSPGESYHGRAYLKAKYKVMNSEFKAERIHATISEAMVEKKIAPGC